MPRAQWPLVDDRPIVEMVLTLAQSGQQVTRRLLADTGAGDAKGPFELLLDENDCLYCGGKPASPVALSGAYTGSFPLYLIRVTIPALAFDDDLLAVGVTTPPSGLDGIACFRFLNRFSYGNFGNGNAFGLEV